MDRREWSVGEAKGRFSELISRAAGGERFVIERRGRPVAAVVGAADLDRLERAQNTAIQLARALGQREEILAKVQSGQVHPAMLAFGLWRDKDEFADLEQEVRASRDRSPSRPPIVL